MSPTSISGVGYGPSDPADTSVSGGTAPYVYLWERTSGSTLITAGSPTSGGTTFYWDGSLSGPPKFANFRCKVTDAASTVAYSPTVAVSWDPAG